MSISSDTRVAIVTGGADGIGWGITTELRRAGYQVLVVDIDEDRCARMTKDNVDRGIAVLVADATTTAGVTAALSRADSLGSLYLFVANVGGPGSAFGGILDTGIDAFHSAVKQCMTSTYLALHHAGQALAERGEGAIVVIGSISARIGGAGPPIYAAAKASVARLAQLAAVELAPKGVRVNAVSPGFVITPMVEAFGIGAERALKTQPGTRAVSPQDVGRAVVFLADPAQQCLVGMELVIDGGVTAQGTNMFSQLFQDE